MKGYMPSLVNNIRWKIVMLFLSYWELNENLSPKDVVKLGAELLEKNLWPIKGVKQLGWYATVDVPTWGINLYEAENVEQVLKGVAVWTNAKPGIFKVVRVSPAMTTEDAMRIVMEM